MRKISILFLAMFFVAWNAFLPVANAWNPGVWKPAEWKLEDLQQHEWKVDPLEIQEWLPENLTEQTIVLYELTQYEWFTQSPELMQWVMEDLENREWIIENYDVVLDELSQLSDWTVDEITVMEWQLTELRDFSSTVQDALQQDINELEGNNSANSPPSTETEASSPSLTDPSASPEDAISNSGPNKYDIIKFTSKMVGDTVNFADKLARQNDASASDLYKYKNNIFYSGIKTFTKGNEALEGVFAGVDTVRTGKKLYEEINKLRSLGKTREAVSQAGSISSASQLVNTPATKTFTPANAIVSTALLPFSIIDTVNNVQKIQSTSGVDRTDAIMSTIGSVGDVITGLAAPVAMIPGLQGVAAGMVVVGTAASLISLGYKTFRKRKEIVKGAKNLAKKIGGFFGFGK
ncbi:MULTISPECIES: hypothetical protein [Sutcliffiella]|uniref:Uncharacterized protein n=1 Tax=Sutcliffiella cohnii TaxID=33932 RepID=A0A223KXM9_9BACI|nr:MULTISPECIES: hypothetical protein [Sutcliffiella]AST94173.1 hypothetical protein BC6307_24515 [Sutcliffiella cohnii]MED4017647.1 hypothetical protein [Sutcliffiella cohnii]WBL15390.1 hypothetical protein O1A01_01635 [Sutcliffiella sp. NC1]